MVTAGAGALLSGTKLAKTLLSGAKRVKAAADAMARKHGMGISIGGKCILGKCFLAGTLVLTQAGPRPIESLEPGEKVLSRDEVTGAMRYRRIMSVSRGRTRMVCQVTVRPVRKGRSERHRVGLASASSSGDGEESDSGDGDSDPDGAFSLKSTRDHPYYSVSRRRWIDADQLLPGERLQASDGSELEVVRVVWWAEEARTYNLEVEGWHTYFVVGRRDGAGAWVHNARVGDHSYDQAQDLVARGVAQVTTPGAQGRQGRAENIWQYEADPKLPKWVRGWVKNERRRQAQAFANGRDYSPRMPGYSRRPFGNDGPRLRRGKSGYVQAHGRTTAARDGFAYPGNTRLQEAGLNKLEESVRRQRGCR